LAFGLTASAGVTLGEPVAEFAGACANAAKVEIASADAMSVFLNI
jgi:hypothetical protein